MNPPDTELLQDLFRLSNIPYISGTGRTAKNLNNVATNLLLVYASVRSAFMFQIIDYDKTYRDLALEVLNKLVARFPIGTFKRYHCCQGEIFSTQDISTEVEQYNTNGEPSVLGKILGYPCSGEQHNARYVCIISTCDGHDIMANMASSWASVEKFGAYYKKISAFIEEHIGIQVYLEIFPM